MVRITKQTLVVVAGGALLGLAMPALADVKAGVDAWSRGDYATAVREWAGPAEQGDPDAQFNLAQAYRLGRGVDANQAQAEALYTRAAQQGHVKAADNLGLILFQKGEREKAMPYIEGAAMRGDPRAQYLLGIAHFNGDLVAKDWRRAYALATLANASGLPQAKGALAQMDEYIPLTDRQAAQVLAGEMKAQAEASRARELAAVDLALASETAAPRNLPTPPATQRPGVDYSTRLPSDSSATVVARAEPVTQIGPASTPTTSSPPQPVASRSSGPWKIQLGAFGVPGNADKLWSRLAMRSELAGREKVTQSAGRLTKLLASGYATRDEAVAACASLKKSGQDCLVTR
ncbi:MAG: SPOR domain-containing protein [Erythrobacter sp.]